MKVVALHTDFRIYWPARLKALSSALFKRGDYFDVIEIAGKGSNYSFANISAHLNIKWHILFPDSSPEDLSGKEIEPKLFSLLNKLNPDVIIAGAIAFPSGALAVRWGQLHNTKIIIFDDSKIEAVKRNPLVNYIKQSVYDGVDALFLPADDWISTGQFWKFTENRMFFGVDVVDNDFWNQLQDGSNTYGNYFIAVGRQIPAKNFLGVMKAFALYTKKIGFDKAYNLILIGDGPERTLIEDCIKENELENKVYLLPFRPQYELIRLYQNAKALCIASKNETWGLVINEAMAAGCPIFASRQCGATNILVKDNVNGYSFDYDDIEDLSEKMAEFTLFSIQKQLSFRKSSQEIISQWGLQRFCDGAISAIDFVQSSFKHRPNILGKIIISRWKGQYKPI